MPIAMPMSASQLQAHSAGLEGVSVCTEGGKEGGMEREGVIPSIPSVTRQPIDCSP